MLGDIVRATPNDIRSGRKPFPHPFDDLVGLYWAFFQQGCQWD